MTEQPLDAAFIRDILGRIAPDIHKMIRVDDSWPVKNVRYRFADILATRITYTAEQINFGRDNKAMEDLMHEVARRDKHDGMYIAIDKEAIKNVKTEKSLKPVNPTRIKLIAKDKTPQPEQPLFVMPKESRIDAETGGTLTYVNVIINTQRHQLPLRLNEEVIYLKPQTIAAHLNPNAPRKRTLTRFSQYNEVQYDRPLRAHVDLLHQRIGYTPDIEEISLQEIVCAVFAYQEVVGGERHYGAIVDIDGNPEAVLPLDNVTDRVALGVKNSVRAIGSVLGKLSRASLDAKADRLRLTRLLMAIAVADGDVTEAEKECLLTGLRHTAMLTSTEQDTMATLLSEPDASFLTDDDFRFSNPDTARQALNLMKEVASSDGESEAETQIIERLKEASGYLEA